MPNTCCILNVGPHYRYPIYQKMAEELDVDFYIGDRAGTPIKTFDYNSLKNYKGTLCRHNLWGSWYWMSNQIRLAFKQYDSYIVTGEPFCISNWIFLLLAKMCGKQTIAWTHGWYGREGRVKGFIKKLFFKLFSKVMCYNKYSAKLMVQQGFKEKNIFVIGNSLNTDKQRDIRKKLTKTEIYSSHFGNDNPVIIYCGRIQKVKRLDLMIEMLAVLKEEGIEANMVFVGKDVDGAGIEEIANKQGLENRVWFYGPCYEEEKLGELFYNACVCVSPGNVGLTAIHALTYGCPVITHDDFPNQMPEFEAIVPGVTGDFFTKDSLFELVSTTKIWLQRSEEQKEQTRKEAFAEIDRKWNIYSQVEVLRKVLKRNA